GVGFHDVHAPGGEDPGDVGDQIGPLGGDEGDFVELTLGAEGELDGVFGEALGHLEMLANLFGQAGLEVSLREPFEESVEGLTFFRTSVGAVGYQGSD